MEIEYHNATAYVDEQSRQALRIDYQLNGKKEAIVGLGKDPKESLLNVLYQITTLIESELNQD
jgi:hypothetical protein